MENNKDGKNLLSVKFLIRLTEKEKEILLAKSKSLKISQAEFLRKSLMTFEKENLKNTNQYKSILSREEYNLLLNIANNLNQNTKFANSNKILHKNLEEAINQVMTFIELKS